jgi:hypothetical protein
MLAPLFVLRPRQVPGLHKGDVKVTVQDGVLLINGERKREEVKEEEGYKRVERSYGSFERRFKVPSNADAHGIKAEMNHGVLSVRIPKREETKAKPVEISVGGSTPEGSASGKQLHGAAAAAHEKKLEREREQQQHQAGGQQ